MRKKSSFTLVEVLIVIIVLAILAAIAIPIYQNRVEQVRIDICTANQEALLEAVKIYEMKNDALPDTIAKAWQEHGDEAFAIVWDRKKKERDYIYLAYISFQNFKLFLADIFSSNMVYAHDPGRHPHLSDSLADRKILNCPSAGRGGYGINAEVIDLQWDAIRDAELIIADVDAGNNLDRSRHDRGDTSGAIVTYKDGVSALDSGGGVVEAVRVEDSLRVVGRGDEVWHPARRAADGS